MNSPMPKQRPIPGRRLDAIRSVETFIISVPREVPYLGPLREGEAINERGYLVRKDNRSIYPASDLSVVVKLTGESNTVGWGETYGIAAPEAVEAIIDDLLAPVLRGRDPSAPAPLHDELYALMRVRGFTSGYYVDALAGVDIAVWDLLAASRCSSSDSSSAGGAMSGCQPTSPACRGRASRSAASLRSSGSARVSPPSSSPPPCPTTGS